MIQKHVENKQWVNTDECLNNDPKCGESPTDLEEWFTTHMIGVVWWTYDKDEKGEAYQDFRGRWVLDVYVNNQNTATINLESSVTPRPLPFKELGTHKSVGKRMA